MDYCRGCDAWLGETETEAIEEGHRAEDFDFRFWAALEMGHLIAAAPSLSAEPGREQIAKAIKVCTERLAAGNVHVFAQLSRLPKNRAHFWSHRHTVPLLNSLLKICYKMCISLLDFLTLEDPLTHLGIAHAAIRLEAEGVTVNKRRRARTVMGEGLSENPPPSVKEIARRLGYKHALSLRRVSPELYLKIVERHRKTVGSKAVSQGFREAPLHPKEQVRLALEEALHSDPALTMRQVAIELGYANGDGALSKRFPELCQALVKRRQEFMARRDREQEDELTKVLRENPPPHFLRRGKEARLSERQRIGQTFPRAQCRDRGETQGVQSETSRRPTPETAVRAHGT